MKQYKRVEVKDRWRRGVSVQSIIFPEKAINAVINTLPPTKSQ